MVDIEKLAHNLSERSQRPVEECAQVLSTAFNDPAFECMSDGEIGHFVEAIESPEQLKWIIQVFQETLKTSPAVVPYDVLTQAVESSAQSLCEYLKNLHKNYELRRSKGMSLALEDLLKDTH